MRVLYLCFIFIPVVAIGEIYKCVKADGSVIYKDTPCNIQDVQIIYSYSQDPWSFWIPAKELNRQPRCLNRCLTRERLRKQKRLSQEQNRSLRLRSKCERVTQKIELLNQRYKRGYTAKQRQSLDRKLAEYNKRRQKYCK